VQLVARMIHLDESFTYFMRSMHIDARSNHARNVI